jgi:hypothetical protein
LLGSLANPWVVALGRRSGLHWEAPEFLIRVELFSNLAWLVILVASLVLFWAHFLLLTCLSSMQSRSFTSCLSISTVCLGLWCRLVAGPFFFAAYQDCFPRKLLETWMSCLDWHDPLEKAPTALGCSLMLSLAALAAESSRTFT